MKETRGQLNMAEVDQHEGEQVLLNPVRTHVPELIFLNNSWQTNMCLTRKTLFWQDIEKKIEETRQRFKNEFLQGKRLLWIRY